MTDSLPDVNVLLALAWPNHQFHRPARRWFAEHEGAWRTCAITQLGFVRLSSNPAFTVQAKLPTEAAALLVRMTRHPDHRYLAELPPVDGSNVAAVLRKMIGHQQVTDGYLVALAQHHGVRLVTFDRRIETLALDRRAVHLLSP